jgi:hypothetical protein
MNSDNRSFPPSHLQTNQGFPVNSQSFPSQSFAQGNQQFSGPPTYGALAHQMPQMQQNHFYMQQASLGPLHGGQKSTFLPDLTETNPSLLLSGNNSFLASQNLGSAPLPISHQYSFPNQTHFRQEATTDWRSLLSSSDRNHVIKQLYAR